MGRKAIATKAAVEEAADILMSMGRRVSASEVRKIIGSGSMSTIQAHLETWRNGRQSCTSDKKSFVLPSHLRESIDQLKRDSDAVLRLFEMHFAKSSRDDLQTRINDLEVELEGKTQKIKELEEKIAFLAERDAAARQEDGSEAPVVKEASSSSEAGLAEESDCKEKAIQKPRKKTGDKTADDERQKSLF